MCCSSKELKGSIFCLTEPLKRKGVCIITEICCRRECKPIYRALYPPILLEEPVSGSIILKSVWIIEDFPVPVLPTMPIFW